MNLRYYLGDVKNLFKRIDRIGLFNTLRARLKNKGQGFIYINQHTTLLLTKTGAFDVQKKARFYFNESWEKKDNFHSMLGIDENATLQVNGFFTIYSGARVSVTPNARLVLGSGYINHGLSLNCFTHIEIGHDVAISDNVTIRDSDNHEIIAEGYKSTLPIKIGNHVWIGMNVTILKGVTIGDGAIIAAGAVVNKSIPARCLAGGVPARVLKENVEWR
jgi:acetyltransferase-like isoleucine patch superfamily enzyme